jgi:hypothetical protein
MIKTSISIRNPFAKDENCLISWCKTIALTENKTFEIELCSASMYNLISISLDLGWRGQDHAGPELHVELFGFEARIKIYDNRHWNYTNGTWERYDV